MKEVRKLITDLAFNYYEHGSKLDTIIPEADIDPIIKYIGDNFVSRVELPVKPEIAEIIDGMIMVRETLSFEKPEEDIAKILKHTANLEASLLRGIKEKLKQFSV